MEGDNVQAPAQTNEQEVRALIAAWADAIRELDVGRVVANHDPDVVLYDVPPPPQLIGIDDYRRAFEGFLRCPGHEGVSDLADLAVVAGGHVAYSYCPIRCRGTGHNEEIDVPLTLGPQRLDGEWRITH